MSVNIHFKSDFKLFESPAKDASFTFLVPFRFAYYTVGNVEYVVSHSNGEYTNCELLEDGRLKVIFENHGLAPGRIMCRREFFLTDEDYADNICDVRLTTATDVFLTMQGRDVGDMTVKVPMFYQKGDKGDPFTWDDMTPEQRAYFIEQVGADVVATNEAVIAAEAARQQYYEQWKPEAERVTNDARTQGMYAATEGLYAKNKGDEAKASGDYAKEQGDRASSRGAFAMIQAEYAIEKAGEAMKAALSANEAGAAANIAAADATTAAQKATDEGDYAKGQGDYAKEQGDKALEATSEAYEALDQVREVITKSNRATANADEAAAEAIEATNRVNEAIGKAESAASSADYAREQLEALEVEFNNAEAARETAEAQRQTDTAKAISDVKSETTAALNDVKSETTAALNDVKSETATALSDMQSKVNTAVGNANQAAGNTNQAIEKANVATNNANSAATNANTAANEAEEAAASANAAKESIQEELGAKADKTGEYTELTAGFAYEILGDGQATAEKFSFRPTGGPNRNVRDGSARIEVLKGNSVVWNQLVNHSTIYSSTSNGIEFTVSNGKVIANGTATANSAFGIRWNSTQGHIYAMVGCPSGGSESTYKFYNQAEKADYGNGVIYTEARSGAIYNIIQIKSGVTANNLTFTPRIYDLTQMFGAGNEPTTVEQFYELLPEGVDINAYNAGEIVDANYKAIKSTGFNQYNGTYAKVLGGVKYYLGGTYTSIGYTTEEGGTTEAITIPSDKFYTPTQNGYIYAQGNDICINIAWDEYSALNGRYKPYKPFERNLSWANKYFPATINGETKYGMRSAGNVADEIRFNSTTQQWEAVQRIGVVDSGSLSWSVINADYNIFAAQIKDMNATTPDRNDGILTPKYTVDVSGTGIGSTMADKSAKRNNGYIYVRDSAYSNAATLKTELAGVMLNYELAEPIVTPVTEDVNLAYDVADYGTEQLIVAEGAQSAPLSAEVVYEPNVLASIKQVAAMLTRIDALETAVATMQGSAVAVTNEEG